MKTVWVPGIVIGALGIQQWVKKRPYPWYVYSLSFNQQNILWDKYYI